MRQSDRVTESQRVSATAAVSVHTVNCLRTILCSAAHVSKYRCGACVFTRARVRVYTYIHICIHMHIYAYTYMHTHAIARQLWPTGSVGAGTRSVGDSVGEGAAYDSLILGAIS